MVKRAKKNIKNEKKQLTIPGTEQTQSDILLFRQGAIELVTAILDRNKERNDENNDEK